ncbi:MAG TPA: LysR family transcriptional regulator [Burkholderiales bacterium]|nr:LysR family transcriptional regulator [Burkholderiales bacterium]
MDQWRALLAVVDAGGYAQAAALLHKSQSTVTYAVKKIESLLDVKVFEIRGRKAVLTEAGQVLCRRARTLVDEAGALERGATEMAADWKPEIRLAVEIIFPTWLLLGCLARFAEERPETRIELYETVLGGTDEALLEGHVDFAICSQIPAGRLGDSLARARFVAAAHPDHPLHRLGRPLTHRDLRRHRQLVIRDSGTQRRRSGAWLAAERRWTVSNKATSIRAATMGLGFAWYPEDSIRTELESGALKRLPLREGAERWAELYLVFADPDYASRDELRLAEIIREASARECARVADATH